MAQKPIEDQGLRPILYLYLSSGRSSSQLRGDNVVISSSPPAVIDFLERDYCDKSGDPNSSICWIGTDPIHWYKIAPSRLRRVKGNPVPTLAYPYRKASRGPPNLMSPSDRRIAINNTTNAQQKDLRFNPGIFWSAPWSRRLRRTPLTSCYGMRRWFDIRRRGIFGQSVGSVQTQHRQEFG